MRISTNTVFQSGISKISDIQSQQSLLQQKISTGRRILTPSDDPVASARALELTYAQGVNSKFTDTRKTAETRLSLLESNLTGVTNLMVSAQSSLVAAGNGVLSNQERGFIAAELNHSLQELLGFANTSDASGNFLYAGFKTSTQPFVPNATGATYAGDSNLQLLQVDSQRQLAVNVTGDNVFLAKGPTNGPNDVFATLSNIITLLNTPITNAATQATFAAGLGVAIKNMQGSLDNVLNVRADIGGALNELDALTLAGNDRDLQYSKSISELQDLDYALALSDLSKQQTIMEAAQKSFVTTTSLSLFKFM